MGLGPVENDALELTLVSTLEAMKIVDVAAGSSQSFAVTESGKIETKNFDCKLQKVDSTQNFINENKMIFYMYFITISKV